MLCFILEYTGLSGKYSTLLLEKVHFKSEKSEIFIIYHHDDEKMMVLSLHTIHCNDLMITMGLE